MINLLQQVARFGSLRLYWDGNNERFVQIPKNVIANQNNCVDVQ